ncbi:hypothetical protein IAS59_003526 [Cryptococcus gattii]
MEDLTSRRGGLDVIASSKASERLSRLLEQPEGEEHAEELAIRKAKEEEAMRKRRIICIPFPLSGRRATQPPRSSTSHLTSKECLQCTKSMVPSLMSLSSSEDENDIV